MAKIKFTKAVIDKLPPPKKGGDTYFAEDMAGFGLRVGKTKKAFFAQKDIRGRSCCVTIGTYGTWTVDEARTEARQLLLMMEKGIDPRQEKRQKQATAMTLKELTESFLDARKTLKPKTRKDYQYYVDHYLDDWKRKPVTDITEQKVLERYKRIGENNGQTLANNVKRVLSSILNYGIATYRILEKNPVRIIAEAKAAYPDNRRRRYIKPHQLKAWYDAVMGLQNEVYRDHLLLILFTGLRLNEASSLKWSQIDFAGKLFTVENTKNGEPLCLPMSTFVYGLLVKRKAKTGNGLFVFPGRGKTGYLAEIKKGVDAVRKASGVAFSCHDLRRTYISIAESLDISKYALSALLNHKCTDITGSYIIQNEERLRVPVQMITDRILELINGEGKETQQESCEAKNDNGEAQAQVAA